MKINAVTFTQCFYRRNFPDKCDSLADVFTKPQNVQVINLSVEFKFLMHAMFFKEIQCTCYILQK